jgi:hypothetical protein
MKKTAAALFILALASTAHAAPKAAFKGQNYSGVYDCKGSNDKVGDYEVTISLKINRVSSHGQYGAYTYEMTTVNGVTYVGQAIADRNQMALSFPLKSGLNVDHSIGIARIVKNKQGRWSFRKHYYEEDNSGGNYGSEYCVLNINKPLEGTVKESAKDQGKDQGGNKPQPKNQQQPKDAAKPQPAK